MPPPIMPMLNLKRAIVWRLGTPRNLPFDVRRELLKDVRWKVEVDLAAARDQKAECIPIHRTNNGNCDLGRVFGKLGNDLFAARVVVDHESLANDHRPGLKRLVDV